MSSYAIEVENLCKTYRAKSRSPVHALDDLSLAVEPGELVGLLGPNGAGKSTLINILSTLTRPTAGRARVNGFDVVEQALEVRRSIAVVLQTSSSEMYLTVWDNFLSYGLFQGLSLTESKRKAVEAIEVFDLAEYTNVKCQDLSGGFKRRVQAAKAFLAETPILFLDEATTGLDPVAKRRILELIRTQARQGRTIFLTTHMLSEAEELCDRIAIIDRGKVKAVGDVHSLKLMAREVYDATVTFEAVTPELLSFLEQKALRRLEQQGQTLLLSVQGPEADVLALLAETARRWPVVHFEVAGASLEDVFVEVLKRED